MPVHFCRIEKQDENMATFFIEQFGCRATQADAAAMESGSCSNVVMPFPPTQIPPT